MQYFEYVWIDGTEPTAQLRAKTKVLKEGIEPGIWGFDGSSTNQAPGNKSDCVLNPVRIYDNPFAENYSLVLCEVLNTDDSIHSSNTRRALELTSKKYSDKEPWFGIEQEYTLFQDDRPLGWNNDGTDPAPQGQYYCGIGADKAFGREIAEEHMLYCGGIGLSICGINAEVMPGQWEFQLGPDDPLRIADDLWIARWLLSRIAEAHDIEVNLDPKPMEGDWNGTGAHTNFSTKAMRMGYSSIEKAAELLGKEHTNLMSVYGDGNERRLTGLHETCDINTFKWAESDRGASIRIPWQVVKDQKGYLEDRRPSSNCDPYKVFDAILKAVCKG
tara:strand:+ start:4722 stop:5711 length:990 start_codon:yes stop_codon:yes gene_type:complete